MSYSISPPACTHSSNNWDYKLKDGHKVLYCKICLEKARDWARLYSKELTMEEYNLKYNESHPLDLIKK